MAVNAPNVDGENKEEMLSNIPGKVVQTGDTDEDLYLIDREIAPMENSIWGITLSEDDSGDKKGRHHSPKNENYLLLLCIRQVTNADGCTIIMKNSKDDIIYYWYYMY
ncbi:TPA: hypothetical protein R4D26_000999 [Salmonella enterica subsp. enterica serovar Stanley]|nr:hypothetical protein [Salmonella enterica subsp. enterica serovar Stanley]